ncbi:MAG: arsenosugar biosynthesis radical SAM protein ArsS [Flavobacteriales bacterium]|nr:arsenosugar biosynthesis radical SAM protein ArsS [Flavobacteriales bacterium]
MTKKTKQVEVNGLEVLDNLSSAFPSFSAKLKESGLFPFKPEPLEIMQINVGYMCNITCDHCHVSAGPTRKEIMTKATLQMCLSAIDASNVKTVDLTGGAPEMNPDFEWFIEELSKRKLEVIVRSNLVILTVNKKFRAYPEFFKKHKVQVIASLPCYTEANTDSQRGDGVFTKSIEALVHLNELGYGKEGTGLELHLVYNPGGPSLPPDQDQLELDYKTHLLKNHGVLFNNLYTITNLPIGRFLDYLQIIGRTEEYLDVLVNAFNPSAAHGVMCRNTLSVGWDGKLYDCDFNQMLDLGISNASAAHIGEFNLEALNKRTINTNLHCYGCTAGAGSSCQGALIT